MMPLLVQPFSNEESTNILPVPWMLGASMPISWNRSSSELQIAPLARNASALTIAVQSGLIIFENIIDGCQRD